MDEVNKLLKQIADIEGQAGELEPTDYEALYKLLAVAYFAAKDVIALQGDNVPVVTDTVTTVALEKAEATIGALNVELQEASNKSGLLQAQVTEMHGMLTEISEIIK